MRFHLYGIYKGPQIGQIIGVDYTTVSQSKKRLKEKLKKDKNLSLLMKRIGSRLSI